MNRRSIPAISVLLALAICVITINLVSGQGTRRPRAAKKPAVTAQPPAAPPAVAPTVDTPEAIAARLRAVNIEFVWIEPGTFQMGTPYGEPGRDSDEGPVHPVKITQGFFIGKFEVTQAQWRAVMNRASFQFRGDENQPAENISWDDVQEFIKRMNTRDDGFTYRLPTEAEWSYAAGAGGHHSPSSSLDEMAWYGSNAGGRTHPVGAKKPNEWGLYDVHGNVWEWVQDWYSKTYYGVSPDTDPPGPETGELRGMRGGGWNSLANLCRVGLRNGLGPGLRRADLGFRLVRVARTPAAASPAN